MTQQTGTNIQVITHAFAAMEKQFDSLLPANVPSKRFMRTALMAIEGNPKLLSCDRNSVYQAVKLAAQDGLILDGREAALVPYGKEAKYTPMVTGIIKRARNTGDIDTITPAIVYENDDFFIDYANRTPMTFKPLMKGDRGKPIGAICIVWNKAGSMEFEWMTEEEIMAVKKCSKQPNSMKWKEFWTEGWKVTVLRRLFKRLPMNSELDRLFSSVDSEYDFTNQPAAATPDEPSTKTMTRAEQRVADQMGDGTGTGGAADAEYEDMAAAEATDDDPI